MKDIDDLLALGLPLGEYAIIGSGPLAIRGVRESRDIDVIVKTNLWEILINKHKDSLCSDCLAIKIGKVEIYPEWKEMEKKTDEMIDSAEIIDDLPFVKLEYVVEWKKKMRRKKDINDLKLLEEVGVDCDKSSSV